MNIREKNDRSLPENSKAPVNAAEQWADTDRLKNYSGDTLHYAVMSGQTVHEFAAVSGVMSGVKLPLLIMQTYREEKHQ